MPIYEFRCDDCEAVTTHLWRGDSTVSDVSCKSCGSGRMTRVLSTFSAHRNMASKLANLDPKYDKMVDRAIRNTPEADPNRHLAKMKPFRGKRPLTE